MWQHLKRDKRFWLSSAFITIFLLLSIGNAIFNDGQIRKVSIQFNKDGIPEVPPYPPSFQFLLGTDGKGFDLLNLVIEGAKWTIGISILIALLRMVFGVCFGVFLGMYVKRGFTKLEAFFDSFTIIPMVMIAAFSLRHAITFKNGEVMSTFFERASFEVILLTALAVPTLSLYVANEIRKVLTEEFVDAARILGGSKGHLLIKHVLPHLYPTFVIVFMQQFVQALIILLHLGLLGLFFGGTIEFFGGETDSFTHEWSGLIGVYFRSLSVHPWIPLVPITCFGLTIYSGNMIVTCIQDAVAKARLREKVDQEEVETTQSMTQEKEELFVFKHTM
ncbi:ABC transporter permease subunit [Bacillus cytotoxicus]|uniref:ABC transporter permease subunit n=1 Tax=Bacillus cytotoxicus TaxID=580165 RepID=A0ACC6AC21_9BACI|nr:ABC transporter permease subunit [Bacillus cytotoxicus]